MKIVFILLPIFIFSLSSTQADENDIATFSGRISRLNAVARLARIKITFENSKFLTKNNKIDFWNESTPGNKCSGYLKGRTSDYLLIRIPKYEMCIKKVHFAVGTYLHMYSRDLEDNLEIAQELVEILHQKRVAIGARVKRYQKQINGHDEKRKLIDQRYTVLKQKLELEWKKELTFLDEDRVKIENDLKNANVKLNDIEYKLEKYRIRDENLVEDRWSLDPKLYFKR